ncbi:MAG: methylenetetrahydrofolate reductase C-terminal domain-containing protein [Ardenticatenaceae bacterium]
MKIARWLQEHPKILERAYQANHALVKALDPIIQRMGYEQVDRWITGPEELAKKVVFDCQMCGQCILHSTGMTCPMTCPKNLRNGPCGGVRTNGHCEVKPEMKCVWVQAFERSQNMSVYGHEMLMIQPPVNRQLEGSSAWINQLTGEDKNVPKGWVGTSDIAVIHN